MRLKVATAALVALLAVVGGFAAAQEEEPPPQQAPVEARDVSAATFDEPIADDVRDMSSDERLVAAQKRIERMRTLLTQTTELLEKVREGDGDILRINCINEKLAAMKGFVKVSEQSYTNLRDAAGRDDDTAQLHHFSLIAVSSEKVRDLGEEAQTCVGEVQVFADESVVDRREDPGLADVDPIETPENSFSGFEENVFNDGFATETLPELTPFQ